LKEIVTLHLVDLIVGSQQGTGIEPQAHATGDRRGNVTIHKVKLCGVDRRLVGGDRRDELIDQRLLGVELLLCREALSCERMIACKVQSGVCELCLVLLLLRRRLIKRGLVRSGIDHGDQVALLHRLPFPHGHLHELTGDACADRH
jgi:hypothetical protein